MAGNGESLMKGVYVVTSASPELDRLEKRRKTETKSLYILKTSEEAVNKYRQCIADFAAAGGVFILVSNDKVFEQNLEQALVKELGLGGEVLVVLPTMARADAEIDARVAEMRRVFLFVEHEVGGRSSLPFLCMLKESRPEVLVTVLSYEVDEGVLARFHEARADNFITKPASTNVLVEKIAFTIEPQTMLEALIRQGRQLLADNDFEAAVATAGRILEIKPNSAAGFMLLGDGLKGFSRRREALEAYLAAEKNAELFIEPLKRIVEFHTEDGNAEARLEYLLKLDRISPLNLERKLDIARSLIQVGRPAGAAPHVEAALDMAVDSAPAQVGAIGSEFADGLMATNPEVSEKCLRLGIAAAKAARVKVEPLAYNRLGLAMRRQGKWQEAVREYELAEALSPEDENIQYNIAMAYAEGKDWKSAGEKVRRAMELNPDFHRGNAIVSYHAGLILLRSGQPEKSLAFLLHVREIKPGYKDVDALVAGIGKG